MNTFDPNTQEVELEQTKPKVFDYLDLLNFESKQIYSAFGKMLTAEKKTSPNYGFGTADRQKANKIFMSKEHSKIAFIGKTSPGPNYQVTDKYEYKKTPEYRFGTNPRNTLDTGPKFDYYLRPDEDFDPNQADLLRRNKSTTARIGLESRFPNEPKGHKGVPGPQYDPSLKHEIPTDPKFSFGFRRDRPGESAINLLTSTPNNVGPGLYVSNKNLPGHSEIETLPKWSIGKSIRKGPENKAWDKNQTYDTKSFSLF